MIFIDSFRMVCCVPPSQDLLSWVFMPYLVDLGQSRELPPLIMDSQAPYLQDLVLHAPA
jgi:hypothetical protein